MADYILGISAYYHDSAAAIISDGDVLAAAQEERFTRIKHDSSFPVNAIGCVLEEAGVDLNQLSVAAFYDKPYIKFERLLETYHAFAPRGLASFVSAIPIWIKQKIFMKRLLRENLAKFGKIIFPVIFPEHHLSHAASAFYPSPFEEAAILTIDGVGEWATSIIGEGKGNQIKILKQLDFPHSVGLLYSAFTYYVGFKVNSGEYKLMGLAPYGNPYSKKVKEYRDKILGEILDIREDGSILMNMEYFDYATGFRMCNDRKWRNLFGVPPRKKETKIDQSYMDMALAIQQITEDIVLKLAKTAKELTQNKHIVLAGGVALNSVANGKILKMGLFEDVWIQPAAGDAGGALGAAYAAWHIWKGESRKIVPKKDSMKGSYLGPGYSAKAISKIINKYSAPYKCFENFDEMAPKVAKLLSEDNVVGWFQGRMEYGPRALGNRSILGDPRNPAMQKKMNMKIKYREGFRPFAPSVLEEDMRQYFDIDRSSPYMLLVVPLIEEKRIKVPDGYHEWELYERLYYKRSAVPAVTHIDYSARVQSVNRETNFRFWKLLNEFKKHTGCGVLINTSFNVRGEPIVCNPEEAYRCFMRTEMDYLVMENFLFDKKEQRSFGDDFNWEERFRLD